MFMSPVISGAIMLSPSLKNESTFDLQRSLTLCEHSILIRLLNSGIFFPEMLFFNIAFHMVRVRSGDLNQPQIIKLSQALNNLRF